MQRKQLDLNTLSFKEFKEEFYSRVTDFTLFDCGNVNLLKVVLDGLKVNYQSKGWVDASLFSNQFYENGKKQYRKLKQSNQITEAKRKIVENLKKVEYLICDPGRIVKDANGKIYSKFLHTILQELDTIKCIVILENSTEKSLKHDLTKEDIINAFSFEVASSEEKELRINLLNTFTKIKNTDLFFSNELLNIKIAFTKFYNEFIVWNRFLDLIPTLKIFIFTCHYHREGQIYAFKKRNIECIELQHGLIAKEDIFYIFPKQTQSICNRALFADKILVFGNYWKEILKHGVEYPENTIIEAGYFPFNDFTSYEWLINELKNKFEQKKLILVTTQTFMHNYYIDYIKKLECLILKRKENYLILVKPHPAENLGLYKNAFPNSTTVRILTYPIEVLLKITTIHISIYSTTLFDCVPYQIPNYTLNIPQYSDYVYSIYKSGIATLLQPDENLFEKLNQVEMSENKLLKENLFGIYKGLNFINKNLEKIKYE